MDGGPPRRHAIDELRPVGERQADALGRRDGEARQRARRRRVRVPEEAHVVGEQRGRLRIRILSSASVPATAVAGAAVRPRGLPPDPQRIEDLVARALGRVQPREEQALVLPWSALGRRRRQLEDGRCRRRRRRARRRVTRESLFRASKWARSVSALLSGIAASARSTTASTARPVPQGSPPRRSSRRCHRGAHRRRGAGRLRGRSASHWREPLGAGLATPPAVSTSERRPRVAAAGARGLSRHERIRRVQGASPPQAACRRHRAPRRGGTWRHRCVPCEERHRALDALDEMAEGVVAAVAAAAEGEGASCDCAACVPTSCAIPDVYRATSRPSESFGAPVCTGFR